MENNKKLEWMYYQIFQILGGYDLASNVGDYVLEKHKNDFKVHKEKFTETHYRSLDYKIIEDRNLITTIKNNLHIIDSNKLISILFNSFTGDYKEEKNHIYLGFKNNNYLHRSEDFLIGSCLEYFKDFLENTFKTKKILELLLEHKSENINVILNTLPDIKSNNSEYYLLLSKHIKKQNNEDLKNKFTTKLLAKPLNSNITNFKLQSEYYQSLVNTSNEEDILKHTKEQMKDVLEKNPSFLNEIEKILTKNKQPQLFSKIQLALNNENKKSEEPIVTDEIYGFNLKFAEQKMFGLLTEKEKNNTFDLESQERLVSRLLYDIIKKNVVKVNHNFNIKDKILYFNAKSDFELAKKIVTVFSEHFDDFFILLKKSKDSDKEVDNISKAIMTKLEKDKLDNILETSLINQKYKTKKI